MSESRTSCTKYAPNMSFFVLRGDFIYITRDKGKDNYTQAAGLRVMEVRTNNRITALLESGKTREEITEEDLWLTLLWCDFAAWTLHLYEERSFRGALPELGRKQFVKQRYVKINKALSRPGRLEPWRDEETGQIIVYPDLTAARHDLAHPGEVVNQFLLNTKAVNEAIDRIPGSGNDHNGGGDEGGNGGGGSPNLPGDDSSPESESSGSEGEEGTTGPANSQKKREASVNTRPHGGVTSSQPENADPPSDSINQGWQNCESITEDKRDVPPRYSTDGQNCQPLVDQSRVEAGNFAGQGWQKSDGGWQKGQGKAGKIASNNNYQQESSRIGEESIVGASRAVVVDPSLFEKVAWTRQAILDLFELCLEPLQPLNEKAPRQWQELAKKMHQDWEDAAEKLGGDSYLALRGLPYLARVIAYMSTPGSPCDWLAFFRGKYPDAPVRPWHIAKSAGRCGQEMEERNWWPAGTEPARAEDVPPAGDNQAQASPANPNEIDLADLAGTAPEERQGMDLEEAKALEAHIRRCHPDYWVDRRRIDRYHRDRGYSVEFWHADGCVVRIYSHEQWDLVVDESEALGTPDFVKRLAAVFREDQVAFIA